MQITLGYLTRVTGGQLLSGYEQMIITGVSTDSRQVKKGEVFFALPGENYDGHNFVAEAFEKGANAAVVSTVDCYLPDEVKQGLVLVNDTVQALQDLAAAWRLNYKLPLIAITGSVGKTTTRDLLSSILSTRWTTLTTPGNFNNDIGLPLTLLRLESEHQAAVVEMAMRGPGEILRLARITQPTAAIITNVEPVHLETLGSLENIARAKCEILASIQDFAVINGDNPLLKKEAANYSCPRYTFGYNVDCDFRIMQVKLSRRKLGVAVQLLKEPAYFEFAIPSSKLAYNIIAAAAIAYLYGLNVDQIQQGLQDYRPTGNRLNISPLKGGGILINDTYNANPVSMAAALETGRELAGSSRFVAVLGDMYELGDYETEGHLTVGAKAAQVSVDLLVTIGEKGRLIAREAQKQGLPPEQVYHFPVKEDSIDFLRNRVSKQDTVLFKASRGMQLETLVNDWLKQD
ncbi:MAG TPA: UDP-N-acetylmuramoyl-tripeptide--D-alanyl-D-alanine ligase [Syntrophomonadaceae bacterium]|nr:UDP-N-acetylmuramoyl-tripeptide--D-alanyl-D-alanine ligase [Syntrophomonadaceae bacterium]HQA06827.1 UDP-N-acetylmuramoyl-tripeptide--D-alanyl-D-alanine ligase [Syntrophomonadaceae bacterium]HQE22759.1 UDP-N-acetylmuramoyl-tripeptide--D-alanyl-D-alanine ligase [Syntrophomonadaceae bacterium]